MLAPKRIKYRKKHKGKMRGVSRRGNRVSFGDYGLQAVESAWISNRQIEGVGEEVARRAMQLASDKLPIKTRFVAREQQLGT